MSSTALASAQSTKCTDLPVPFPLFCDLRKSCLLLKAPGRGWPVPASEDQHAKAQISIPRVARGLPLVGEGFLLEMRHTAPIFSAMALHRTYCVLVSGRRTYPMATTTPVAATCAKMGGLARLMRSASPTARTDQSFSELRFATNARVREEPTGHLRVFVRVSCLFLRGYMILYIGL